jgi:hypothetical protein
LNPLWKLRYFDEIQEVLKQDAEATLKGDSQIIIATHDPLMVGSLRKEQVGILKTENGKTKFEPADEHPQGMGVAGLLKSKLFGLLSTLDQPTLEKLHQRNTLLAIRSTRKLEDSDERELKKLTAYLDELGFAHEYRDPQYQQFIEKMYKIRSKPLNELFTADELKEREDLAQRIVTEIVKREKTDELSDLAKELKMEARETK